MRKMWIVIADAARAVIVSKTEGIPDLSLVQRLENPLGRARNIGMVTDQPGRSEKHGSHLRSTMDPPSTPHEQNSRVFAHDINHLLNLASCRDAFETLVLVAPAHFLGLLRVGLKTGPAKRLVLCLDHDFTRLSLGELETRLGEVLQLAGVAVAAG